MAESGIRQQRTGLILPEGACEILAAARVLVLGTGGVGGYAVENLARAGIGHLTLIDGDTVDESNCNRQLSALTSTIGRFKAEVWCERCREINPAGEFTAVTRFLRTEAEIDAVLAIPFDFAVDAIDELGPKIDLLLALRQRGIPCVSAMGAGGKLDPSMVRVADISKTEGCPLARAVRRELRAHGVTHGVQAVYSPEIPVRRFADRKIGSICYMPAIFGCFCAAEAISVLISRKNG